MIFQTEHAPGASESVFLKVDSHHDSHDLQPRRRRKGLGQLRRDKERAAKHRAESSTRSEC